MSVIALVVSVHSIPKAVQGAYVNSLFIINAAVRPDTEYQRGADTLFVENGRIRAVGRRPAIEGLKNSHTRLLDLKGKVVLPGFIDAHIHLRGLAERLVTVDAGPDGGVSAIADIQEKIYRETLKHPAGTWIRAGGYNEVYLAEQRDPDRRDLDRAAPDHPVRLTHRSGHAHVLNSMAIKKLNISVQTPDPPGGMMDRDIKTGEPTGIFYGSGDFLADAMPPLSQEQMESGVGLANGELLKSGITTVCDASVRNGLSHWQAFEQWQTGGLIKSRIVMMHGLTGFDRFQDVVVSFGADNTRLAPGPVKIMLEETTGFLFPSQAELNKTVWSIHQAGLQVAIHAIDAPAVSAACTAIELAQKDFSPEELRHRIEHCSMCPPQLVARVAAAGIMVVSNPSFLYYSGDRYLKTIPRFEQADLYPFQRLLQHHVMTAAGSDAPVVPVNPLAGIYGAVTRKSRQGDCVFPAEKIDVRDAVAMYTKNAAKSLFADPDRGSIAPGKLADLVVLSHDPFEVDEEQLKDIQVERTIIGGETVYQRNRPVPG